jgi:hypothetical protein
VSAGRSEGAAGHVYVPILFRATGGEPCTLRGYPTIVAVDAAGDVVARAGRAPGPPVGTVVLRRGRVASALVAAVNVPGDTPCPPEAVALLVTPPGARTAVRVPVRLPACAGMTVGPVVAGSTGQ